MRALLVCAAPVDGSAVLIASLAPDYDVIIGVDGGAVVCEEAGLPCDLVVGDLDSIDQQTLAVLRTRGARIVRFPAEKDVTDLDLALDAARELGAQCVTITACTTGRLDHTLAVCGSLARNPDLAPIIIEPGLNAWLLDAAHVGHVDLAGPESIVSLCPLLGPARVTCHGMRWPLDAQELDTLSSLGLSNLITAVVARVRVHEGCVLVQSPQVGNTPPARPAL